MRMPMRTPTPMPTRTPTPMPTRTPTRTADADADADARDDGGTEHLLVPGDPVPLAARLRLPARPEMHRRSGDARPAESWRTCAAPPAPGRRPPRAPPMRSARARRSAGRSSRKAEASRRCAPTSGNSSADCTGAGSICVSATEAGLRGRGCARTACNPITNSGLPVRHLPARSSSSPPPTRNLTECTAGPRLRARRTRLLDRRRLAASARFCADTNGRRVRRGVHPVVPVSGRNLLRPETSARVHRLASASPRPLLIGGHRVRLLLHLIGKA